MPGSCGDPMLGDDTELQEEGRDTNVHQKSKRSVVPSVKERSKSRKAREHRSIGFDRREVILNTQFGQNASNQKVSGEHFQKNIL